MSEAEAEIASTAVQVVKAFPSLLPNDLPVRGEKVELAESSNLMP